MKQRPTEKEIKQAVCGYFGVPLEGDGSVGSGSRNDLLYITRAIIVHIGKMNEYSYPQIAPFAGYKSHSGALEIHHRFLQGRYDSSPVCKLTGATLAESLSKIAAVLDRRNQS